MNCGETARKIVLKCDLSPGDIVMLTGAVREMHRCHPGEFTTDVRTPCHALWEHNPYLTALKEPDADVEVIECHYPLIHRSNEAPYHFIHGYIEFLNERLGLRIQAAQFKGDIHISDEEKSWYSQIREVAGEDIPFWIIVAGGKCDVTIKWWDPKRWQAVVDHFRGKIQFVQVGQKGHHHPALKGVIDLRERTDLRQLVRLIYHAQGVLCPVTSLMHLAAAVPVKEGGPLNRPCVVVAGGREPSHWEAYPHHQFIHTCGALLCCDNGGCWKARTQPLGDAAESDAPDSLCVDVVDGLPCCMNMITPDDVIRRIEPYFHGGAAEYLTERQACAAHKAVALRKSIDGEPLDYCVFRKGLETKLKKLPRSRNRPSGRGIVVCGGGRRYFPAAWVCIKMLRRLGCARPFAGPTPGEPPDQAVTESARWPCWRLGPATGQPRIVEK